MTDKIQVCVASLSTEEGIKNAAVKMAEVVCFQVLWPMVQHTPVDRRADLFERFFAALTGAMVAEVGPERAQQALDAAKLAIDDLLSERAHAH